MMREKMQSSRFVRFLTNVLIFFMIIQGMPLAQLSQAYAWHFEPEKLERIFDLLGPATASAAPPVAEAGADQEVVKTSLLSSTARLDGSGSFDPDGDTFVNTWYGPFGAAEGVSPSVTIPQGIYTVTLSAMGCPQSAATDTVEITVVPAFAIAARSKTGKVQLTWTHLPEALRYDVYRSSESDPFTFEKIAETTSTYSTYLDLAVANETNYLYAVAAIDANNAVQFSNIVAACPPASRTTARLNRPPFIYSPAVTTATTQMPYDYTILAADANLDTLSYSLTAAPAGMIIDPATGRIQWTAAETGAFQVTATVTDPNGLEDEQSFSIDVMAPTPLVSLSADPETIVLGQQSATLGWCTTHADYAIIDPDIGEVDPVGSLQVLPDVTTIYTITALDLLFSISRATAVPKWFMRTSIICASTGAATVTCSFKPRWAPGPAWSCRSSPMWTTTITPRSWWPPATMCTMGPTTAFWCSGMPTTPGSTPASSGTIMPIASPTSMMTCAFRNMPPITGSSTIIFARTRSPIPLAAPTCPPAYCAPTGACCPRPSNSSAGWAMAGCCIPPPGPMSLFTMAIPKQAVS